MKTLSQKEIQAFRRKILTFYKRHGRDLPFRRTDDPYKIAVAEFMLQQTQVERILPKYEAWVKRWPTWQALAGASPRELLSMWSGLGYNRRALYLGRLAQEITERFDGRLPDSPELLQRLPGIGPYTARAILIFAFNRPLVTIDTNIRRVLAHEFDLPDDIDDRQMESFAERLLPRRRSRDWHNALMDYSRLALPKRLAGIAPRNRQSRFAGSIRQIRGEIIRRLTRQRRLSIEKLIRDSGRSRSDVHKAIAGLKRDGLISVGRVYVSVSSAPRKTSL